MLEKREGERESGKVKEEQITRNKKGLLHREGTNKGERGCLFDIQ